MKNDSVTFSERFTALRQELGLTQIQLAERLYMDKSTVAKYETGERVPQLETLIKIADYFDVSLDYLVGRKAAI